MRIGLVLDAGCELEQAALAEAHGLFGVVIEPAAPGAESVVAAAVASVTEAIRLVVTMPLGVEHPVTLAEEVAVLDNVSGGRIVVLADASGLSAEAAAEDVALLRRCWSARPVRHRGPRWQVPAGIEGHDAPDAVMVTPEPAQVEIPVWVRGATLGLPVVAQALEAVDADVLVQPAEAPLSGDLEADRDLALRWAAAGATHLLVRLPADRKAEEVLAMVSRFLVPEVAMPHFPRVIAESPAPATWRVGS